MQYYVIYFLLNNVNQLKDLPKLLTTNNLEVFQIIKRNKGRWKSWFSDDKTQSNSHNKIAKLQKYGFEMDFLVW